MAADINLLLASYFSGNCSPLERQQVLEWSRLNAAAFKAAEEVWRLSGNISGGGHKRSADEAWQDFKQRAQQPYKETKQAGLRFTWFRIAAALLILAAAAMAVRILFFTSKEPVQETVATAAAPLQEPETVQMTTIYSGDSVSVILLPDSTKISLNKNSQLQYASVYNIRDRIVYMQGEAFFEVRHNDSLPFLVVCGDVCTKVTGTIFDIHSFSDNKIEINVVSGTVEVSDNKRPGQKLVLQENEKAVFSPQTASFKRSAGNEQYLRWQDKKNSRFGKKIQSFIQKIRKKNPGKHSQ